jgi:hypothetical protein
MLTGGKAALAEDLFLVVVAPLPILVGLDK